MEAELGVNIAGRIAAVSQAELDGRVGRFSGTSALTDSTSSDPVLHRLRHSDPVIHQLEEKGGDVCL